MKSRAPVVIASGLTGSARALALVALQHATRRKLAIVTPDSRELEDFQRDLQFIHIALSGAESNADQVLSLPASDHNPYDGTSPHPEVLEQRARTLFRLTDNKPDFLLMPTRSLLQRTVAPGEIQQSGALLKVGAEHLLE